MATRAISTHLTPVACEVCGRNLLRGENADVFLVGGQQRMVCELCVGRATHEGWLRAGDAQPVPDRVHRGRRARTLMGRLRQRNEAAHGGGLVDPGGPSEYGAGEPAPYEQSERAPDGEWHAFEDPDAAPLAPLARAAPRRRRVAEPLRAPRHVHAVPANAELKAARALEVFNAGDGPRRVAGVARSLGEPMVCARSVSPEATRVRIVVAWELCWYRYEVDLGDEADGARLIDQGLELDELPAEDQLVNAGADERGELQMLAREPDPA